MKPLLALMTFIAFIPLSSFAQFNLQDSRSDFQQSDRFPRGSDRPGGGFDPGRPGHGGPGHGGPWGPGHGGGFPPPSRCLGRSVPAQSFYQCCSGTLIYWESSGGYNACYWQGQSGSGGGPFDANQDRSTPCITYQSGIMANQWVCK